MGVAKAVLNRESWGELVSYLALALVAVAVFYAKGWFYLTGDIRAVVSSVPDDTGYFYKIAWNVVNGKGLTFDGINPTNGFQPLWLYMLLPLAWLMREATPEAYFRAALVYEMLIVFAAAWFVFRAVRQVESVLVAALSTSIFLYLSRYHFVNGMETGVLMLCLAGLLDYSLRSQVFYRNDPRTAFGFGVIAGLLLLARLDTVFLVGISYIFLLMRSLWAWRVGLAVAPLLKDVALSMVGLIIVTLPYFIYNKLAFGALMPISGQLKNSFPYVVQPEFGLARFRAVDLGAVAAAGAFCLGSPWLLRHTKDLSVQYRYFIAAVMVSAAATILHYINTALFMKWAVFGWHFALYHFTYGLVLVALIIPLFRWLAARNTLYAIAGALALMLLVAFRVTPKRELLSNLGLINLAAQAPTPSWHAISYEAALWARQNTPSNAIFAMKDAGIFGLFSQRTVINLDGLVNTKEYQEALRQKRLNQYLAEKNVEYLVQHAMWDDMQRNALVLSGNYTFIEMPYRSQLYGTWSDPVRLYRTDEVFRKVYHEQRLGIDTVFVIWRLRHAHNPATE